MCSIGTPIWKGPRMSCYPMGLFFNHNLDNGWVLPRLEAYKVASSTRYTRGSEPPITSHDIIQTDLSLECGVQPDTCKPHSGGLTKFWPRPNFWKEEEEEEKILRANSSGTATYTCTSFTGRVCQLLQMALPLPALV